MPTEAQKQIAAYQAEQRRLYDLQEAKLFRRQLIWLGVFTIIWYTTAGLLHHLLSTRGITSPWFDILYWANVVGYWLFFGLKDL